MAVLLNNLVAPAWEQAQVLADRLACRDSQAVYHGSQVATRLKVMGVELTVMGEKEPDRENDEVVTYTEPSRGIYKKLIVRNGYLAGAILLGDGLQPPVSCRSLTGVRPCRRIGQTCCFPWRGRAKRST